MPNNPQTYPRHRFPIEIISHAVWLYHRFTLSFRDIEEMLAERGVEVTYESIRQWCMKFGPEYARKLKQRRGPLGDIWHLDEVFIKIRGKLHYLWRAVDQDGEVIDILVQNKRDKRAAKRFFRMLLNGQQSVPWKIVTDKLKSYSAAIRELMPSVVHCKDEHANNRAEVSHQRSRQQERQMRRFKSPGQAQRFLAVHSRVTNLFVVGRHHIKAATYRMFRGQAFVQRRAVVALG
jgi:putative transposase